MLEGGERDELIRWVRYVEHQLYELPHPDLTIFLDLPVEQATRLIALKAQRSYTDRAADLQEADRGYLQMVHDVYQQLALTEPHWVRIDCFDRGVLKSVEQIGDEVWLVANQTGA